MSSLLGSADSRSASLFTDLSAVSAQSSTSTYNVPPDEDDFDSPTLQPLEPAHAIVGATLCLQKHLLRRRQT